MKSTLNTTKCLSTTRRVSRSGKLGTLVRAHTPARHQVAPARAEPALTLQGLDLPAYVEEIDIVRARQASLPAHGGPRVLHVDTQTGTATVLASLLGSDIHVTHVATVAQARQLLQHQVFSLVILDPTLPDGDASVLLPLLAGTPLLVYSDQQPEWRDMLPPPFLSKSWTTARQLWTAMSAMLLDTSALSAGD